jgi:hypothetical protein
MYVCETENFSRKTKIGLKYMSFLGHCVSPDVTFANLSKVEGIQNNAGPSLTRTWVGEEMTQRP